MRYKFSMMVAAAAYLVCVANSKAQDLSSVCTTLASGLKQDVLLQGSNREKFINIQQIVAQDKFSSYSAASSTKLDLNISILDFVDAALGTKSDNTTWSSNRERFLKTNFEQVATSASVLTIVQQTSEAAVRAVVDCGQIAANQSGFFSALSDISSGRSAFVLRLYRKSIEGDSNWELRSLTAKPEDAEFKCSDNFERATPANPKKITGLSVLINCAKSPDKELLVTANTSAGSAGPFKLVSIQDDIAAMRERVAMLEAALNESVPRGTLAYFDMTNCPSGWAPVESAKGRYIVALQGGAQKGATVGTALGDKENRPTGAHTHPIPGGTTGPHGAGVQTGNDCCTLTVNSVAAAEPSGAIAGTNAPYIQYPLCEKR